MYAKKFTFAAIFLLFTALLATAVPSPVVADGGPIVPHDLWADLE